MVSIQRQKRPTIEAKETYYRGYSKHSKYSEHGKYTEAKETYYRGKRDLL